MLTLDPEARGLLAALPALLPEGAPPASLVLVFATRGSAPRGPGARLLCRDGQLLAGTIGGGRLEERAIARAVELEGGGELDAGRGPVTARYQLGPELAQCCGGVVELAFFPIDHAGAVALAADLADAEAGGAPLRTVIDNRTLEETPAARQTVVIFGAGHVGTALATVLSPLPWRVLLVDGRPAWADPARVPAGVEVCCAPVTAPLAAWGWLGRDAARSPLAAPLPEAHPGRRPPDPAWTAAVVMTHDHGLDRDLADALLRVPSRTGGPPLRYLGVIGSKTKIAALRRRLGDRGLEAATVARLIAPIGLRIDGALLGGKLPGEIALSVAAQLLAIFSSEPGA